VKDSFLSAYKNMKSISFSPKQITKRLISVLPDRSQDVLQRRFGIGKDKNRQTLESIGEIYGITRERVRQIENHALKSIAKSKEYEKEQQVFKELENLILSLGGIVAEDERLQKRLGAGPERKRESCQGSQCSGSPDRSDNWPEQGTQLAQGLPPGNTKQQLNPGWQRELHVISLDQTENRWT